MRIANIKEAAAFTRLSVPTLYKYRLTGQIPFIKVSARLLFDLDSLEKWLRDHGHEPAQAKAPRKGQSS